MANYHIIDRRKNPSGKNLPNRKRFIDRAKEKIKERLKDNFNKRSISNEGNEEIIIDIDGIDEPNFSYDLNSGEWNYILPGNKTYVPGDKIQKPKEGGSKRGGAGKGESEDSFVFSVNREEYLNILFDDLELPDLIKQSQKNAVAWERRRAGYSKSGPASKLDLPRTLRGSLSRRIALGVPLDRNIKELSEQLAAESDNNKKDQILKELEILINRRAGIAYIDPVDVRYKRHELVPMPNSQAVMFCIMDVSGSMGEREKEISKRFFLLLYLFLQRQYRRVDIVFISHTDTAKEVTEEQFFYSIGSGGTEISSSLILLKNIIQDRYSPFSWNLYCVQSSDGDNITSDNKNVENCLQKLLPVFQYYVYNEISGPQQSLYERETIYGTFNAMKPLHKNLEVIQLLDISDVVPSFRRVFAKKNEKK